jgi:CRP-like cAMP-binding protein
MAISSDHAQLVQQLRSIGPLDAKEAHAIAALPLRVQMIGARRDLHDAASSNDCCLVLSGLVCRYQVLRGGRRQIFALHLAGDLPDLQSLVVPKTSYRITAATESRIGFFPRDELRELMRQARGFAEIVHRHAIMEASIYREWIIGLGRRTAVGRAAHLLCEMYTRMKAAGLANKNEIRLSMTQSDIGDCLGLSTVHVNRVLQELRAKNCVAIKGSCVTILDWDRLAEEAEFDPGYLV